MAWPWRKTEERDATETLDQTQQTFYDVADAVIALCSTIHELERTLKEVADDIPPDET